MAKIKNVSGEGLTVPALGGRFVKAGQVIPVPDDQVYGFTQQAIWDAADSAAEAAHADAHEVYLGRRAEELGGPVDEDGNRLPPEDLVEPPGNASLEVWVDYVVRSGLATPEDLEGKKRDEIRDEYSTPDTDEADTSEDAAGDQATGDTDSSDTSTDDGSH